MYYVYINSTLIDIKYTCTTINIKKRVTIILHSRKSINTKLKQKQSERITICT